MKRTIVIKDKNRELSKTISLPNKDHFDIQRKNRSMTFINRKKREKQGYTKHKNKTLD